MKINYEKNNEALIYVDNVKKKWPKLFRAGSVPILKYRFCAPDRIGILFFIGVIENEAGSQNTNSCILVIH